MRVSWWRGNIRRFHSPVLWIVWRRNQSDFCRHPLFEVWVGVQTEPDLAATSDGYTVTCVIVELTETKWCYISLTFKILRLELKVRQAEITKVVYRCVVL